MLFRKFSIAYFVQRIDSEVLFSFLFAIRQIIVSKKTKKRPVVETAAFFTAAMTYWVTIDQAKPNTDVLFITLLLRY
jgi:hypothetical protein